MKHRANEKKSNKLLPKGDRIYKKDIHKTVMTPGVVLFIRLIYCRQKKRTKGVAGI